MDFLRSFQRQQTTKPAQRRRALSDSYQAGSQMYEVPLEKIFGSSKQNFSFPEHRRFSDTTDMSSRVVSTKEQFFHRSSISYHEVFVRGPSSTAKPITIPIIEQTQVLPEHATTYSTLTFSIYHDIQRSALTIYLQDGHIRTASPDDHRNTQIFVCMYLHRNRECIMESRKVPKHKIVTFQESFDFHRISTEDLRRQSVILQIYESPRPAKKRFIGSVVLPLHKADLYGVITTMKIDETGRNIPADTGGDLHLSLMYSCVGCGESIQGTITEVTNLPKQDVLGLADPYVKVQLIHKGMRYTKWKSTVKRNTLTTVFNESFWFDISGMDIQDIRLVLVVMDYDHFSPNDLVGRVFVGKDAFTEQGKTHWAEVISSPNVAVSHWHSIELSS